MSTIHVDIVSAEGEIFSGPAAMVYAPAQLGEIGIAPNHAPLLTGLKPGGVRVQTPEGEELFFYVSGGMIEIQPKAVTVLADAALRAHDLDEAAVLQARQRAQDLLENRESAVDIATAQAELAQISAQVALLQKIKKSAGQG
ncbi:MAG: F0F1 ATP synthase subunit epsilon [Gammaproteobacteria bacterium]|jgi:F-type H+-transporting ATPase subunit epsilon